MNTEILSAEQMKNIRDLILDVIMRAEIAGWISTEEKQAIIDFCVNGEAALGTLEDYKKKGNI